MRRLILALRFWRDPVLSFNLTRAWRTARRFH
jgi:hypothetical protein